MVWNSAQTPLYQAVRAHNERDCADSEHTGPQTRTQHSKPQKPPREAAAPVSRGIDRDMLLILMIIFILQSEKADNGLILALLITMIM